MPVWSQTKEEEYAIYILQYVISDVLDFATRDDYGKSGSQFFLNFSLAYKYGIDTF